MLEETDATAVDPCDAGDADAPFDLASMKRRTGWRHLIGACAHSAAGLRAAVRHEAAFRHELAVGVPLLLLVPWLAPGLWQGILMAASVVGVWIVELLNSALEALADAVSQERHVLLGRAKDIGSAAVMLSLLLGMLVWLLLLWPA